MSPQKPSNPGKNWNLLKEETSTTKKIKGGSKQNPKMVSKIINKPSKNKRKDNRQKIQQEAIRLLNSCARSSKPPQKNVVSPEVTNVIGIDCEYVGIGFNGAEDCLARVSIVNEKGETIYDRYVKPTDPVTDYRTHVSGVQPGHLLNGLSFAQVQSEVRTTLANKIVVGHAVHNDFRVLKLSHPFRLIRDTSKYKPFREALQIGGSPSLKVLAEKLLGIRIQEGHHSSVVDARTSLRLYLLHRKKWDDHVKQTKRHLTLF